QRRSARTRTGSGAGYRKPGRWRSCRVCLMSTFRPPRIIAAFLLFSAGFATGNAAAQEAASDAHRLDEVVVTATRREASVRDVARSVSVVDRQSIQNATQQLGLDEVLAGVPGLYMENRYNFSQDLSISLRGFGSRAS